MSESTANKPRPKGRKFLLLVVVAFLIGAMSTGHWLGSVPRGVFFPLTRDELVQTAAAVRAIRAGELDRVRLPEKPRDILAQQMVAAIAAQEMSVDELFALVRRAYPYRDLERAEFEELLDMLVEGVATQRGRRAAHLHRDRVHEQLRGRRGARLAAITGGGAIADTADYDVIEEPSGDSSTITFGTNKKNEKVDPAKMKPPA